MKKKLNLICFLLFCALGLTLFLNVVGGVEGTNEAWQIIKKDTPDTESGKKIVSANLYTIVRLAPAIPGNYPDSVFNEKTQKMMPVQYNEITTGVDKKFSKGELFLVLALLIGILGSMLMAFLNFIKFIRNINGSNIFVWSNVRYLKQMGFAFLIVFFINLAFGYLSYSSILHQISIAHYRLDWTSAIQTTNLIIGLACLLIAEIFAIGLRLKEEQDLTI